MKQAATARIKNPNDPKEKNRLNFEYERLDI
jgi:hypothetical protein